MQKTLPSSLVLLICCCSPLFLLAQSDHRELLSHYPLMGDLEDITGNHSALSIANILVLDSAVYSDGANSFSDTANRINGNFPELDHDDVYISLEFKLDSIPGDDLNRSILVAGSGWRWLAASYTQTTGEIKFRYNNWKLAPGTFRFNYDQWYQIELSYQRESQTGRMFIDGELMASDTFELNAANDRTVVLDCFCGYHAMGGYWRNLKIYGPDTSAATSDTTRVDIERDSLDIRCTIDEHLSAADQEDGVIKLEIDHGTAPYTVTTTIESEPWVHQSDTSVVFIRSLSEGSYLLSISDSIGTRKTCELNVLPPQTALPLVSHYPMLENGEDLLGNHDDLVLTNVPLDKEMGIFSADHSQTDTFSQVSQVYTFLDLLDLDHFYISLEVNIDSIPDAIGRDKRSIFVLGQGWRQLAPVYHQIEKVFRLNYNNWKEASGNAPLRYEQWYEVAAAYDLDQGIASFYLDRQLVSREAVALETNNDRSFALWCNCGPQPMQGYWRNLKI